MVRAAAQACPAVRHLGRGDCEALPQIEHPPARHRVLGKEGSRKARHTNCIPSQRIAPARPKSAPLYRFDQSCGRWGRIAILKVEKRAGPSIVHTLKLNPLPGSLIVSDRHRLGSCGSKPSDELIDVIR